MVFSRLLIANRGEIAVRIARACADAGIRSVAVYAPEDRDAMHVRVADEAFALGGESLAETYLNPAAVVDAAVRAAADAVHPGYGFLAESAGLARAVAEAGLTWVGPPPKALELVSNKLSARALAARAGVAMVPASPGPVADAEAIIRFGSEHGYPLVVKACYGGGGRGMRVARSADQAAEALAACRRESEAAFGRPECFVERFLERPRHVETQCLADALGAVAVVSTRDCTVQRRHQKLIEEAPAPFLSARQAAAMAAASRSLLFEAGYRGAATCEFLIAPSGEVFFMEINPRLQVEHCVTEEVTGVDLVREQLRIAWGEELGYADAPAAGHAIEFRINAEDPAGGFLPAPGLIRALRLPGGPGVRCDFGYDAGDALTGSYDSLIGKVTVRGRDRAEALARGRRALAELRVDGVPTVRDFHLAVCSDPAFAASAAADFAVHTGWIEQEFAPVVAGLAPTTAADPARPAAATARMVVEVDGKRLEVVLPAELAGGAEALGDSGPAGGAGATPPAAPRRVARKSAGAGASGDGSVSAPMRGTVVRVATAEGESVRAGDLLVVLEAMKMEQPLTAPRGGVVRSLDAVAGQNVAAGHLLCLIQPD
ncbi:MAG: ATP-grasp domain-containing protein [Bifidobacteriaceae bacterium]|jgi:acetyl-CoA/propionyl-CoA carboxylase biotin carboxyl carrier protein|nr:ATP-grasp domain-containing protein [Bifidobacteriaceae bacterium]